MSSFSPLALAKTLNKKGMTIFDYDPDRASFILENEYPNAGICDDFNKISFDIFIELMRIEMSKTD